MRFGGQGVSLRECGVDFSPTTIKWGGINMGVWWGRNGQIGQVATSRRQIERREVVVTFGGQTGIRPYR